MRVKRHRSQAAAKQFTETLGTAVTTPIATSAIIADAPAPANQGVVLDVPTPPTSALPTAIEQNTITGLGGINGPNGAPTTAATQPDNPENAPEAQPPEAFSLPPMPTLFDSPPQDVEAKGSDGATQTPDESEVAKLRAEIEAIKSSKASDVPEEVAKELEELRALRKRVEMESLYKGTSLGMEHVDDAVAVELRDKLVAPIVQQATEDLTKIRKEQERILAELEQNKKLAEQQARESQARELLVRTNSAIMAQHPDFTNVMASREFQEFMNQPAAPGASVTVEQVMRQEYSAGRPDYINKVVTAFKSQKRDISGVQSVNPTVGSGQPTLHTQQVAPTYADVANLKRMYTTGRVSKQEYLKQMAAFRDAGL